MVVVSLGIMKSIDSLWKSPNLTKEEEEKEKTKSDLKESLKRLESRLESAEILITNSQLEDAKIILYHLSYDFINFQKKRNKETPIVLGADVSGFVIPESPIKIQPFQFLTQLPSLSTLDEDETDTYLEECFNTYDFLSHAVGKEIKSIYKTQLDDYRKLRRIQIFGFIVILVTTISSYLYYQYKYPEFKDQNIELYSFLDKEHSQTTEDSKLSIPLKKEEIGKWVELSFPIPEAMNQFGGLRIDPLQQRGIRFVLDDLQILDATGKILYSKKFIVGKSLLPEDYQDFLAIVDVKTAGKQEPGEIVEMITTGRNPQIHLVFPMIYNAKTIKLKMKYIEAHKVKKK
ncbi:Hypothetical protein LBF_1114 [Leptospira biflexa serovar Patoc strain 'Patoc 1 (Ames)']|uniref:Uncharacterized protein n=2 Tax=Leptospira biflexa TaxID=172 RepID=B0SNJ0_LEPBP|nr:Hypothetical protein LBF_1114 [Leptospira biflexa serovar Patoc strain 'Patoc 1 (Ames)']ABZ97271.1 Hypothetical protein LEPBI_I1155 [Leptospira biflexa serovar Patoc strain 'Patoc 1 (Paris)']